MKKGRLKTMNALIYNENYAKIILSIDNIFKFITDAKILNHLNLGHNK